MILKDELILSPSLLKKELPVPPVDIRACVGKNVKDPYCKNILIELSKKQCGPQLNPKLTAYSPQEGLELIQHEDVQAYWRKALNTDPPDEAENSIILFLPCSRNKPYIISNQHKELRRSFSKHGYELSRNGVYINSRDGESFYPVVVSEPMGVVPYQFVINDVYPVSHYDCPGFFDYPVNRGWQVTPYREDNTAHDPKRSGFKLGPNEKRAQEIGLRLLGEQVAKWVQKYRSYFKGAVGLLKTPAHQKILIEARKILECEISNVFDKENKKKLLDTVAHEKYVEGTTTYNRITGKTGIGTLDANDLMKISLKLSPKNGRRISSKSWGERAKLITMIRDDPEKIEELKWKIANKSAHLLLSQKPFYSKAIVTRLKEDYTPF